MAVITIRWSVRTLTEVMAAYDTQKVYRSTTGEDGAYSEITDAGTRVDLVEAQYNYSYDDDTGQDTYWYKISYYNSVTTDESAKSDPIAATGGGNYLSIQDMRVFGWTATQASNAQLLRAIMDAEAYLEKVTGQWFNPRKRTNLRVNGNDARDLVLRTPIIQIDAVRLYMTLEDYYHEYDDLEVENTRIANRHLTQGLMSPDDRDAPSISLVYGTWPEGTQNVELEGWFGYTELAPGDPVGETSAGSQVPLSTGETPVLVKRACMLLAAKMLPTPADPDAYDDEMRRWQVTKQKMRDQEINYAPAAIQPGGITGDREVDRFLDMFLAPVEVAFV